MSTSFYFKKITDDSVAQIIVVDGIIIRHMETDTFGHQVGFCDYVGHDTQVLRGKGYKKIAGLKHFSHDSWKWTVTSYTKEEYADDIDTYKRFYPDFKTCLDRITWHTYKLAHNSHDRVGYLQIGQDIQAKVFRSPNFYENSFSIVVTIQHDNKPTKTIEIYTDRDNIVRELRFQGLKEVDFGGWIERDFSSLDNN